jgi:uncharacterized protein YbaR (Trm112 family)
MRGGAPYYRGEGIIQNPLGQKRALSSRTETGLEASELYCPRCKAAMPVRERLLLVLPDGELHEYLCVRCGSSLGERTTRQERKVKILVSS